MRETRNLMHNMTRSCHII